MSLLKDESGANAVEYAVIMALVADFVISAVILVAVVLWPAVAYGQSSELMD